MITILLTLPLISAIITGVFGRLLGQKGSITLILILHIATTLSAIMLLYNTILRNEISFLNLSNWIRMNLLIVDWAFCVDSLTEVLVFIVSLISLLVQMYSYDYMKNDPQQTKFFSYLSLFTFFMIILITGDNFVVLFVGWEGVGICSYLLINFWSSRVQANKSAIKAIILNRVGDLALTIGIILSYKIFKSVNFSVIFPLSIYYKEIIISISFIEIYILELICLFLFIGAVGKSAQIGLHMWLPDAMEGPTPVSALIHAATMVTAGVFLIIKCSPMFEYVPNVLLIITIIGSLTALISASIGFVQYDVKKVIAFSTCSQLGYMIMVCGLSNYIASFFHLINHAFFKALLFLSSGSLIHSLTNEQDMRKYGALINLLPYTTIMFLIGSLALMGFPYMTGFYSKDFIIDIAYTKFTIAGNFAYIFAMFTAFLTICYSLKLFYVVFIAKNRTFSEVRLTIHELPTIMSLSLVLLVIGSIVFGYVWRDLFIGLGSDFFTNIVILPNYNNFVETEFYGLNSLHINTVEDKFESLLNYNNTKLYIYEKLLPMYYTIVGVIMIYLINLLNKRNTILLINDNILKILWKISTYLCDKWFFDYAIKEVTNKIYEKIITIYKHSDKGWIEELGPKGIVKVLEYKVNKEIVKVNGVINQGAEVGIIGITVLIWLTLWIK